MFSIKKKQLTSYLDSMRTLNDTCIVIQPVIGICMKFEFKSMKHHKRLIL